MFAQQRLVTSATSPRVSVIIPSYNAGAFIDEAVQSALTQTHRNLEVIVVDDGSTDDTLHRLARFGDRIIVHSQANAGCPAARNAGASHASGEWLAFLDADDTWLPDKLERQLNAARAPLVYTNRYNIGARGALPAIQTDVTRMHQGDVFLPLLLEGNFITVSSVMLRRDIFERTGRFCEALHDGAEDWDLWIRVAEHHPVCWCAEPLVCYRFHVAGMSRNDRSMRRARQQVIARALALDHGRELPWTVRRRIRANTWLTNGWNAVQAGARGRALVDYARAAIAWPWSLQTYKEAVKLCIQ